MSLTNDMYLLSVAVHCSTSMSVENFPGSGIRIAGAGVDIGAVETSGAVFRICITGGAGGITVSEYGISGAVGTCSSLYL